jgi:hypothetical protein
MTFTPRIVRILDWIFKASEIILPDIKATIQYVPLNVNEYILLLFVDVGCILSPSHLYRCACASLHEPEPQGGDRER